ncbi:MAG TPA: thioesterase family protein [Rhodospirillales bacterium]|nr:thioesterase family protein [Rhodospirillales bacterium]
MTVSNDITGKARTDPAAYAFWTRDTVRFSDVDRYRHINNVAIATYCETGRVEYAERLWPGSTAGESAGWVIVKLTVGFLAQAHYPGEVRIGTRVERIGRTSVTIGQGLFKDGACFATGEAILVWVRLGDDGGPMPFPQGLDAVLRAEAARPSLIASAG